MIFGIIGNAGSGKDTIANMIAYIYKVGIPFATYADYIIKKVSWEKHFKNNIVHFADNLKEIVSKLYNIDLHYFYDEKYKDKVYYNITNRYFVKDKEYIDLKNYKIINIEDLENISLRELLEKYDDKMFITLRTLLQYFGTNICKNYLSKNIWILNTINKIKYIEENTSCCIIPDIRFKEEYEALKKFNNNNNCCIIKINRNKNNNDKKYNHISEQYNYKYDVLIDNNSTKANLFFKVLQLITNLENNKIYKTTC